MFYEYHEICLWLPHKPETVADITADMKANGFRPDRAIVTYEGKILDGRHRYEAALEAGVDPVFTEFSGDKQEAIKYVTSENVARRHLNNEEKAEFYIYRAESLGVRKREDSLKQNTTEPTNVGTAPSAEQHAHDLGVAKRTVERWEHDRKDIRSDLELSDAFDEGGLKKVKEVKKRRMVVPPYDVANTLGALKGMAQMYSKRYEGTQEHAVNVLISELIKGCGEDEIGMSIARDSVKWFLNFKEVLDLAQPKLEDFLQEKPELKIVN